MATRVYAVIGLGVFGTQLVLSLVAKGCVVVAIDSDKEALDKVKGAASQSVVADTSSVEFLRRVDLDSVDTVVVALSSFDSSALTVAFLKQAGVPYILARAETPIHATILKKIGADEVFIVEVEQGLRLAQKLASPDVLDVMPLSQRVSLAEVLSTNSMINKSIKDLDLRNEFGLNIVAIRREILSTDSYGQPEKTEQIILPTAFEVVIENDVLIVVGSNESLEKFKDY